MGLGHSTVHGRLKKPEDEDSLEHTFYPYGRSDDRASAKRVSRYIQQQLTDQNVDEVEQAITEMHMVVTPDLVYQALKQHARQPTDTTVRLRDLLLRHYDPKRVQQPADLDAACQREATEGTRVKGVFEKKKVTVKYKQFLPLNIGWPVKGDDEDEDEDEDKGDWVTRIVTKPPNPTYEEITWYEDPYGRNDVYQKYHPNFDQEWINANDRYLQSLDKLDLLLLKGYTFHGDNIVNAYLRRYVPAVDQAARDKLAKFFRSYDQKAWSSGKVLSMLFPAFKALHNIHTGSLTKDIDEIQRRSWTLPEYVAATTWTVDRLQHLILNGPATTTEMVVHRGVRDNWWKHSKRNAFVQDGFMSTTLARGLAFKDEETSCCLKKIILPPGTHGLFLEGLTSVTGELEVLLPHSSAFSILNEEMMYSYTDRLNDTDTLCDAVVDSRTVVTMKLLLDEPRIEEEENEIIPSKRTRVE